MTLALYCILLLQPCSCIHSSTRRMSSYSSSWFRDLFGFDELQHGYHHVQSNFRLQHTEKTIILHSMYNSRSFPIGRFTCRSVKELRETALGHLRRFESSERSHIEIVHDVVEDALQLHCRYPGAVIQAASQLNCLEFPHPNVTPEHGVTDYVDDDTQGPACAMACAGGTVYRNYFAPVRGGIGQTAERQFNNLDGVEEILGEPKLWQVKNGYIFSTEANLSRLLSTLRGIEDEIIDAVRVGVHEDVGVTFQERFIETPPTNALIVTQIYCSALSCAYSGIPNQCWEQFARLVLDACYEATLWASVVNSIERTELEKPYRNDVFLTLIGGGVFGNDLEWILTAMIRAIKILQGTNGVRLRIHVCHHRKINLRVAYAINKGTGIL